jgi:hypothetical protein
MFTFDKRRLGIAREKLRGNKRFVCEMKRGVIL